MNAEPQTPARPLAEYRDYLHLLLRMRGAGLRSPGVDDSDLVQQTLLRAQQRLDTVRGTSHAQFAAWLRVILASRLADAARAQARQVSARSLEAELDASSRKLEAWIACESTPVAEQVEREEQLLSLATALAQLPRDQREALEFKHLHGMKVADIAGLMNRSVPAVAGLLRRGLEALRERLTNGGAEP